MKANSKMNTNDLYICTTYYHIYVLLLKILTGHQIKCDVVICDDLPTGEELQKNLIKSKLFNNVWFVRQKLLPEDRGKNRLDRIFFQHRRRFKTITKMLPFNINKYNNIFIFHDDTSLGRYLNDGRIKYHLIEDSYNFYQHILETPQAIHIRPKTKRYALAKFVNSGYFPMGESKFIIDVEVNDNNNLWVKNKKIIELSRDKMRNALNNKDKKIISTIFGNPTIPQCDNCVILLTESFSSDGVCSADIQYKMYKFILNDLKNKGYYVIIKPHPRDTLDYSEFDAMILDRYYPFEVLVDSIDSKISVLATISSSARYSIKVDKLLQYDYLLKMEDFFDVQ